MNDSGPARPLNPLSEAAQSRELILGNSLARLRIIAERQLAKGIAYHDIVLICIEVDTRWRGLVDVLMPGADWDSVRRRGASPIAHGAVTLRICDYLREEFPSLETQLQEPADEGMVKAIVLDESGCTVYDFDPAKAPKAN